MEGRKICCALIRKDLSLSIYNIETDLLCRVHRSSSLPSKSPCENAAITPSYHRTTR